MLARRARDPEGSVHNIQITFCPPIKLCDFIGLDSDCSLEPFLVAERRKEVD